MTNPKGKKAPSRLDLLRACLDEFEGRYLALRGAADFGSYVAAKGEAADELTLTEPVLVKILERVLGFPTGAYFPQLGKGGLKPDLTPTDLIAHRFVLDAKRSDESLAAHEPQIRAYIRQRSLDSGVLFNLRELRVYRAGEKSHDPALSFRLLPLWQVARGEALPGPEVEAFERFCEAFSYRDVDDAAKVRHIRVQPSWQARLEAGEPVQVDVEYLVRQLRDLARVLTDDAAVQARDRLDPYVALTAGRAERLIGELRQLALDLEPGVDLSALPDDLEDWRGPTGLTARVWRQYLLRVSYLALTRILLYRAWEDVHFVDEVLYDGGFDSAYERLDRSVRNVLDEAFLKGAARYRSLFSADNNYVWYKPREPALLEVLYRLAPIALGKLDADVLGSLYVSYVDEIDRDRLGQFFTPRPVVKFMLDRAGLTGPDGLFRIEGDTRKPLRIFDFATGSGGFLVEAARRIVDESGVAADDGKGLHESLAAIARGFVGGEISPFPYYLTEINLLLQTSRLLGRMKLANAEPPDFVLGTMRVDSLAAKSGGGKSIEGLDAALRADRGELVPDDIYDVLPIEPEKLGTWAELREDETFDLVVGNPPYVAEANNKPLFAHFKALPGWKGIYRGKTDYLYYFLWLAVEKLRPGGRLCVITPVAWTNAGSADFLRGKLAAELTLDELYLFGGYRLFADEQGPAPTPTVESMILVATKAPPPSGHKARIVALEDEAAAPPERQALLDEMVGRARGRAGRKGGIHVHSLRQSDLRADIPWPLKFGTKDVPARVVAHLQARLDDESPVEPLATAWKVFQGIQTGADAYTKRIDKRLSAADRRKLEEAGAIIGDPILELPTARARLRPWSEHPEVLAKAPESRGVLYGAIDDDFTYLVVLRATQKPPREVLDALKPYRPLLETRAEIVRNPHRSWWEAAWPRGAKDLAAPKVIALYRTDRGRFALDETGEWQPSIKSTIVVGREKDAPVAYLCGLLNSELLDLWYAVRGKTPWHIRRNYEPKRMNEMPYRRPDGDPRAHQVAELVRAIAANRRALLPHRSVIRELGRIVKDPWKDGPVEVDLAGLLGELPKSRRVSVRLDSELATDIAEKPHGRPRREEPGLLTFRRGQLTTARIEGDPARLDLLEQILGGKPVDDVSAVELPKDLAELNRMAVERVRLVRELLADGRRLAEEVERLVCSLYDVPEDLTDAVVAHAVARGRSGLPAETD